MTELVIHELVTVTADEASRLEEEFLNGLDQAQDAFVRIMETNAWAALGHDSFADWWEQRVVPVMRALSMRPSREIAAKVLEQVQQDEAELPRPQRRTQRELADLVGVERSSLANRDGSRSLPRDESLPSDLGERAKPHPDGASVEEPSAVTACESCGGELDSQNAQVGYLRCEGCDSEGDHVASTFPAGADGLCVVCNPDDPQVRAWLESSRPENVFGKYYDPEKHGAPTAAPEPMAQPERPAPPRMTEQERREHEESVRRTQDIAAAHRASESIVHDLRVAMVTIVTGCRYGEKGLVTKDTIADLRQIIDQLEEEL